LDPRLEEAIKLINDFVADESIFLELIQLGQMLNISEARDLLEKVSAALSDNIFYGITSRINNSIKLTSNSCDLVDLVDWTDQDIKEVLPYFITLSNGISVRRRKQGCENEYEEVKISLDNICKIHNKKIPDLIYMKKS
jgi:hypothetical protein